MPRYDATTARVFVFTFKEGLLSAVAHDLKLEATRFTLEVEGGVARLALDAASLRVVCPMKEGQENPSALPRMMYGEIEKNAARDVLDAPRFPQVQFISTQVTDAEVVGQLSLHGKTLEVRGARSGDTVTFRLDLRPFGIKPYSAMLGTLKVKPEVVVEVKLSA